MGNKVAYNACFGGFGLSEAAYVRYGELIGKKVYIDQGRVGEMFTAWTVPPNEIREVPYPWLDASLDARKEYNDWYERNTIHARNLDRHDPILIQVIEELGDAANGSHADLKIHEIKGNKYRIEEYDGREDVVEPKEIEFIEIK